jgi:hypothetical protein
MPNYSRKQNTDNYPVRVERQITKADELLRRLKAPALSFDDLIALNGDVEQWLVASRSELNGIYSGYSGPEIAESLSASTGLDLEAISRQDAIKSLERIVLERVARL